MGRAHAALGGPADAYWDHKRCRFASNERVAEAVRAHPDRLLGNTYLDPRETSARDTLRRFLELGFKAVKLLPPAGFDPGDERFFGLCEHVSGSGPWTDGIPLVCNALGGQHYIPIDFARVIWGSDDCLPQTEHLACMAVYLRQIGAGSRKRALVFGDNARKLLKLA